MNCTAFDENVSKIYDLESVESLLLLLKRRQ